VREEVGEIFRVVADDESCDVDTRGLEVRRDGFEEIVNAVGHAVIAYERVCEDEDLALV
jgi:hypothetical protein